MKINKRGGANKLRGRPEKNRKIISVPSDAYFIKNQNLKDFETKFHINDIKIAKKAWLEGFCMGYEIFPAYADCPWKIAGHLF